MMPHIKFSAVSLALLFLDACASRRISNAPQPQTSVYHLTVTTHPAERALDVSGTLAISPSGHERSEIRLSLIDRIDKWNVDIVEPGVSAGLALTEQVTRATAQVAGERSTTAQWIIRPQKPIPAGNSVTLRFSYRLSGRTSLIYYVGPEVAFGSGWGDPFYPVVPGTQGVATGDLTVEAPQGWKVITGAKPRSSDKDEARGIYRFTQSLPTPFTFLAGPYTVVKRDGATPLSAWLLTRRKRFDEFLPGASAMLDVLSNEFGPYVFNQFSLVEVPRAIAIESGFNAFSPAGFVVLNSRAFDARDARVMNEWLGHEMTHQWFPHSVTWDPPGFLYLEEALAEYGGLRIVEVLDGSDAAKVLRTTGSPSDPIYSASAYFKLVGAGVDQPLSTMKSGINERNLAYNKGFIVFDMLAREMGRDRFQRMMQGLTNRRSFQTITWNQFRDAVAKESRQNMDWFFTQWLDRAGAPEFHLAWKQDADTVRGTITQPEPYYRATLKVEARGVAGEIAHYSVQLDGGSRTFAFPVGFHVRQVELDPGYEVLRWTPQFHALADSMRAASRRQ